MGDDDIVYETAISAGGASEFTVRGPHDLEAQSFKDAGGFESIGGDIPVSRCDHQPPAVVGGIGYAAEDVNVEVPDATSALAVDVGHEDGRRPTLEPKPAPDASWVVGDAIVVLPRRELYADFLSCCGEDAGGEVNVLDDRRRRSCLESLTT